MSKIGRPSTPKQTDLTGLSFSELQDRFATMYTKCTDTPCKAKVQELLYELQVHQIELEMQNRELSETQQQLEEARDRYADLYDFAPVCYITFDATGCIQEINLTGASMLGQERERLQGKPFSHWLSAPDVKKFFKHIQYVQKGYHIAIEELQLKLANGLCLDVRLESIAATQQIDNKPTCRSVIIDITARKQVERELRDQSRQLRLITDAMPLLIAYVDREERYQFVNKYYIEWFGLPRDRIVGKTVREVTGDDTYAIIEQFIHCALAGKPVSIDLTVPFQKQGLRDINANYIPDFGVDGTTVGFFVQIRDVTEVKKFETENKMRLLETAHVERVNTMGEMVAEIAHELNQPLAAISIYSDTVSRMLRKADCEHQQDIFAALDEIKLQAERASQVISRLREFVSKNALKPVQTDINALVNEVLHLVAVEARWNNVEIECDMSPAIPSIYADKILIEQVILNLSRNAIEAMAAIKQDKRRLLIRTSLGNYNQIELSVEDSGPGLAMTEIERIFEAFYSSKKNGMGMGLAICRSIIKAHHGRLWAIPNEIGGTTFTFTLSDISSIERL